MNLVFSTNALQLWIEYFGKSQPHDFCQLNGEGGIYSRASGEVLAFRSIGEDDQQPRIFILADAVALLLRHPDERVAMLQRIHRAALSSLNPPLRLPMEWTEFHVKNLVSFYARQRSNGSERWVMELGGNRGGDLVIWTYSSDFSRLDLGAYAPKREILPSVLRDFDSADKELSTSIQDVSKENEALFVQSRVDLEDATFVAVTRNRAYSGWLPLLTERQNKFLKSEPSQSVKLRGPAGSGKSLTLQLKALRETYLSEDKGEKIRVLFATHSWAIAEQTDQAIRLMDERGSAKNIEVFPLLEIAKNIFPAERAASGYALLGEDSLSGRRIQLSRIDGIVEDVRRGDWMIYRAECSEGFRSRVEAQLASPDRNAFVWDLMNEFSSVLSANGILPGINARKRYLSLPRNWWMMRLESDMEKVFVLDIYTKYVQSLMKDGYMSSDQLVNDFLSFLETFAWNLQRVSNGYDIIFVDELHLFSAPERLALHYLSRNPDRYPVIYMALDPRQSPSAVYPEFPVSGVSLAQGGDIDESLGSWYSIDLATVHRFTPEILNFIRHIHLSYPALDLGPDWEVDLDKVDSSASSGSRPELFTHSILDDEIEEVVGQAKRFSAECDGRVAVIVFDVALIDDYERALNRGGVRTVLIAGRDDVEQLRYSRKSVVLSVAEYVAGLQFDRVIICGLTGGSGGALGSNYETRRFLALLYLAVSRATLSVSLHHHGMNGDIPDVIGTALREGLVVHGSQ